MLHQHERSVRSRLPCPRRKDASWTRAGNLDRDAELGRRSSFASFRLVFLNAPNGPLPTLRAPCLAFSGKSGSGPSYAFPSPAAFVVAVGVFPGGGFPAGSWALAPLDASPWTVLQETLP